MAFSLPLNKTVESQQPLNVEREEGREMGELRGDRGGIKPKKTRI